MRCLVLAANGSSDSPSITRSGFAPASSTIVGAMSMLDASCVRVTPAGKPGPRTTNGTLIAGSKESIFSENQRCSPLYQPLSETYMITVLSSSPVCFSVATIRPTISSIAWRDSTRSRWRWVMTPSSRSLKRGNWRTTEVLSETSSSLTLGANCTGIPAEVPSCRGAACGPPSPSCSDECGAEVLTCMKKGLSPGAHLRMSVIARSAIWSVW